MKAHYEPGRYYVEIVGQGLGESKEKKTPYVFLTIKVMERIISSEESEPCAAQYERTIFLYLTDKTVDRVADQLLDLGWEGTRWSELDPSDNDGHSFVGAVTTAQCDQELYKDEWKEKWQLPGKGGLDHEIQPDTVRKIDALFGAALKGGKPKTKPKPKAEVEYVPPHDDDVPF